MQKTGTKGLQDKATNKLEIWSTRNCARDWNGRCTKQNLFEKTWPIKFWDLEIQPDHLIPPKLPDHVLINKTNINLVDFAVRLILFSLSSENEIERKYKYLNLARGKKRNMRLTVIPFVLRAHGTVPRSNYTSEKESILYRSHLFNNCQESKKELSSWRDLLPLRLKWKTTERLILKYNIKLWIWKKWLISK